MYFSFLFSLTGGDSGVIMGELLVSKRGLGYLIMYGSQVFNINLVITSVFILGIIAYLMYKLITIIENKYNKNKSMTFEINKNSFLPEVSEDLEECAPVENSGRKELSDTSRAREEIKKQIEYDVMVQRCQPSQLDELVEIMLEVRMNLSPTTRFSRDEVYPTVYVQDRYSRLNA